VLENARCAVSIAGQLVIPSGARTDRLYFLIEGAVEVLKDDVPVAVASQPRRRVRARCRCCSASRTPATVRAAKPCSFYHRRKSARIPQVIARMCLHVCELLARASIPSTNISGREQQFEGHDHIDMVDGVGSLPLALGAIRTSHPPCRCGRGLQIVASRPRDIC